MPTRRPNSRKALAALVELPGVREAAFPARTDVELARLVKDAPAGDLWLHEIKLDGYRMLCRIRNGQVKFVSRNQRDWTGRLTSLAKAFLRLNVDEAILDGEVVAFRADGVTEFQTLQNAFSGEANPNLYYYAFDVLYLNGFDVRKVTLQNRKALLETIIGSGSATIRYSEHVVGNGEAFFNHAKKLGLEGIISKHRESPYTGGRGADWVKVKATLSDEFVIAGFTDPGVRGGFGSLMLGYFDDGGRLIHAGNVGTGFSDSFLAGFRATLDKLSQASSPFADYRGSMKDVHWVKPKFVCQVAYTEWTRGGHLRHPSFLGLREDKAASRVVRDRPRAATRARTKRK